MLKVTKLTPRQEVAQYACYHGLAVSGTEARGDITIVDTKGHWSEVWSLQHIATWSDARAELLKIEEAYHDTLTRPWEVARQGYTGEMKAEAA
jgi:hypothetical protein